MMFSDDGMSYYAFTIIQINFTFHCHSRLDCQAAVGSADKNVNNIDNAARNRDKGNRRQRKSVDSMSLKL